MLRLAPRLLLTLMVPLAPSPALAAPSNADEALLGAIAASDLAGAEAALAERADANAPLAYGESLLARAVETQDPAMVALLLRHRARPDAADAEGLTPLSLACERGDGAIVASLLDAGANLRRAAPDGTTPLAVCARFAPAATVARMLALGARPDAADARGQTPLMWAASSGNAEAVKLLLAAGAKVERVTTGGFTPLFFAIKGGSAEAVAALLDAGADARFRGPENTSALQLALYQKSWEAAQLLLERGLAAPAALEEIDRNGNRPLHVAAMEGPPALVAALLAKGADANGLTGPSRITWVTEANFGMPPPPVPPTPPLLAAAKEGRVEAMKLLVGAGARADFVAANGTNVVLAAAAGRRAATLDYAMSLAPDADVQDGNGATPLHRVLAGGMHPELQPMLRLLAAHRARTDIPDKRGNTAAQFADEGLTPVKEAFHQAFGNTSGGVLAVTHD